MKYPSYSQSHGDNQLNALVTVSSMETTNEMPLVTVSHMETTNGMP